jgi:branched-chain amino acid transport system substrate-binding protein
MLMRGLVRDTMRSKSFFLWSAVALGTFLSVGAAFAQDTIKIGLVVPLTGLFGSVGRQAEAGARLYMAQHGDTVADRKIQLIVRDDTGAPEVSRRIVEELIASEGVSVLGVGITPCALAIASLVTESKIPAVVMISGTSFITEKSPYFVHTSWTHAQQASVLGQWAAKNGYEKANVVFSDWAPGIESSQTFTEAFVRNGGAVIETIKVPLKTLDFSPYLEHVRSNQADTLFIFVPSNQASILARQFVERGLDKLGLRLIGPGDITDDQDLNGMGDAMLGTVTAGFYSADHVSKINQEYVAAYRSANGNVRPNFISVGAYDGMHLIYAALQKTGGHTDGDSFIAAVKGMAWESPRGPMSIDDRTRDVIHNIYIRRVEKVADELNNVEVETFENVKDPLKPKP